MDVERTTVKLKTAGMCNGSDRQHRSINPHQYHHSGNNGLQVEDISKHTAHHGV